MNNVLNWFTGKGREKAQAALEMLQASEAQGYWVPGTARKVKAAFSKANVAQRAGRRLREIIQDAERAEQAEIERRLAAAKAAGENMSAVFADIQHGRQVRDAHALDMALAHGSPYTSRVDFARIEAGLAGVMNDEVRGILETGKAFCADFAPVDAAIAKLDATRPKPTFTSLGVSKTVHATLRHIGVEGTVETVRPCPMKWTQEQRIGEDGKTYYVWVGELDWPAGTIHDRSRYAYGTDNHRQCHACGHAIKNPYNWAALLIDDANGTPISVWVGKDCARSIFGIEIKGDLELKLA